MRHFCFHANEIVSDADDDGGKSHALLLLTTTTAATVGEIQRKKNIIYFDITNYRLAFKFQTYYYFVYIQFNILVTWKYSLHTICYRHFTISELHRSVTAYITYPSLHKIIIFLKMIFYFIYIGITAWASPLMALWLYSIGMYLHLMSSHYIIYWLMCF